MVAGERFPFQDDLVPLLGRPIEAGHQEMQIGSQRPHHSNLILSRPDNGRHQSRSIVIDINEAW